MEVDNFAFSFPVQQLNITTMHIMGVFLEKQKLITQSYTFIF